MAYRSYILLNGTALKAPHEYSILTSRLDSEDSGRNEDGSTYWQALRANIRKVNYVWRGTPAEINAIRTILETAESNSTPLTLKYYDYVKNEQVMITAYPSADKEYKVLYFKSNAPSQSVIEFKCNFIEM